MDIKESLRTFHILMIGTQNRLYASTHLRQQLFTSPNKVWITFESKLNIAIPNHSLSEKERNQELLIFYVRMDEVTGIELFYMKLLLCRFLICYFCNFLFYVGYQFKK